MPSPTPAFLPNTTFLPSHPRFSRQPLLPLPRLPPLSPHCSLVAVAGATGGVGRLLTRRLLSTADTHTSLPPSLRHVRFTGVRALVRTPSRAARLLPSSPLLELRPLSSTATAPRDELRAALRDVAVLVICTGTTAFPTRAWAGGNTPAAVDDVGVYNLVRAVDPRCIERVVLMSSIGTSRGHRFPFALLNLFGVMDAKRRGERHVVQAAREGGFAYAVVRPGRLIGAPHSNIGALKVEPRETCMDVRIERGDTLMGDLSRKAAADALYIIAHWDPKKDLDVCLVHKEGRTPHFDAWEKRLRSVATIRWEERGRLKGFVDV